MRDWKKDRLSPFLARQDGAVAVEFVILFPLFILILMGIMEFGHLWYVDHVITNASREGARAAVVYVTKYDPHADRQTWAKETAEQKVEDYLEKQLDGTYKRLPGILPTIEVEAGNDTSESVKVTITVSKASLILNLLIKDFSIPLTAATTMRME